jgi:hypothetical protein
LNRADIFVIACLVYGSIDSSLKYFKKYFVLKGHCITTRRNAAGKTANTIALKGQWMPSANQ